jgi:hypothetical protein
MFKKIINEIQNFSDEHLQIGEFGWGPIDQISTANRKFVMVWLLPTGLRQERSSTIFKFDMYVFDLLKQDLSNLLDVFNDTALIGKDIISEFYDNEEEYGFSISETDAEPFDHEFDDFCGGWNFSIEIEIENPINTCEIPQEGIMQDNIQKQEL